MRWTLWEDRDPRPGAHNMAIDVALMEAASTEHRGFIRLYQWEPHCLSFGCNEPAARRYDRRAIEARGLDVVRRPTGGRAVWHAHELTYAVAAPEGALGSLRSAYLQVHLALARALQALGVPATLAPPPITTSGLEAGACFGSAAGGEVTVEGAKLVGSAQLRRDGAMLQHGSLLLDGDQAPVAQVGGQPAPAVMTLQRALGRPVSWQEAAGAIQLHGVPALASACDVLDDASPLLRAAQRHHQFGDPGWTWRR